MEHVYLAKHRAEGTKRPRRVAPVTVVEVDDRGVSGDAGVEVGHQRSDVLRGRQHAVDHVARVDEPWRGGEKEA